MTRKEEHELMLRALIVRYRPEPEVSHEDHVEIVSKLFHELLTDHLNYERIANEALDDAYEELGWRN